MTLRLSEIVSFLIEENLLSGFELKKDVEICGFSPIDESRQGTLSWMRSQQLDFDSVKSAAVICSEDLLIQENSSIVFIPVAKPRLSFAKVLTRFASHSHLPGISSSASVGKNCIIGERVFIGENTVVSSDVSIDCGTIIHSNVSIYSNVKIGKNCIIHSGVVIGSDGFGFEKDEDGILIKIPHIGGVIIGDNVEIGANTCIDRGTLSNTVIGNYVKIDNLCHIAHNVQIGENSTIIALSMIAGSVKIGKNCWIAPCAAIKEKLVVNDGSLVGLGAVVIRDVVSGDVVAGVPARSIKK